MKQSGPVFVQIASGSTVSSAFTLPRGHLPLAIFCASHAAGEVRIQFAPTSGTPPFEPLFRSDGSGLPFVVTSGNGGWGLVPAGPSPYGRLVMTGAAGAVRSFTITEVNVLAG